MLQYKESNTSIFNLPVMTSIHLFSGSEVIEVGRLSEADFHPSSACSSAQVSALSSSGPSLDTE